MAVSCALAHDTAIFIHPPKKDQDCSIFLLEAF